MSKEAVAWLILRVMGLLLLAATVCLIFETLVHFITAQKLSDISATSGFSDDLVSQAERQALRTWVDMSISLVKVAIAGGLSFHFLRKGKALQKLLMWED